MLFFTNAKIENSLPMINSSTKIFEFSFSSKISLTISVAILLLLAIKIPIFFGIESIFIVTGNFSIPETNFKACSLSVNTTYLVVGIFNFSISCLVKYLLDSILVADFVGPNSLKPFLLNSSFIPSANTSAGPTIVKSIFSFIAKFLIFSISYISISTFVAPSILQFPGKT